MTSLAIQFSDTLANHGRESGWNPIGRFAFVLQCRLRHFPGLVVSAENLFDRPEADSQSSSYSPRWVLRGYERTGEAFLIKVLLQLNDQLTCVGVKRFFPGSCSTPPEQSSVGRVLAKNHYANKRNRPDKRVQGHVKQAIGLPKFRSVRITVNDHELLDEKASEQGPVVEWLWEKTFDVSGIDLGDKVALEIFSNIEPLLVDPRGDKADARELGVAVRGIKLLGANK